MIAANSSTGYGATVVRFARLSLEISQSANGPIPARLLCAPEYAVQRRPRIPHSCHISGRRGRSADTYPEKAEWSFMEWPLATRTFQQARVVRILRLRPAIQSGRNPMRLSIICCAFASLATAAIVRSAPTSRTRQSAPEKRCGWLVNPTPANWSLVDHDGEWTMGDQGGYRASGIDELPDMSVKGMVKTNGNHGYSCACLSVRTDRAQMRISQVISGTPMPLNACRADARLKRPS